MAPIATGQAAAGQNGKAKLSSKDIMHMEHEYSAYVFRSLVGREIEMLILDAIGTTITRFPCMSLLL